MCGLWPTYQLIGSALPSECKPSSPDSFGGWLSFRGRDFDVAGLRASIGRRIRRVAREAGFWPASPAHSFVMNPTRGFATEDWQLRHICNVWPLAGISAHRLRASFRA